MHHLCAPREAAPYQGQWTPSRVVFQLAPRHVPRAAPMGAGQREHWTRGLVRDRYVLVGPDLLTVGTGEWSE